MMRIAGVVLAGGQSRRFGSDKAEELFRGRPLIDWSLDALQPHAELLLVSGRPHPVHETAADRPRAGLGPLGGLAGALLAAQSKGFSHLLSVPCDTPVLPAGLLAALTEHDNGAYAATCPVIGFWSTGLGEVLERHLEDGGRRAVMAWAETTGAVAVDGFGEIPNVNSVADLAKLAAAHG